MNTVYRTLFAICALLAALPSSAQTATATMDAPVKPADIAVAAKRHRATVLVFVANRCGVTWLYADKISALQKQYAKKGVAIVGIHSNFEETNAELADELKKRKMNLTILDDKKTQELATYFGATVTPYFVVIDGNGVLRYRGAFDKMGGSIAENKRPQYLLPALDAVLAGKPVAKKTVRALGCEIARSEKTAE